MSQISYDTSAVQTVVIPGMLDASDAPQQNPYIRMISVDLLEESANNPRKYFPQAKLADLTKSIREGGFNEWQAILVRPKGERYEIGAGHRRFLAACEVGLKSIPCFVKEMSDGEFLDVLNFDNSNRDDVHPLDEAAGWRSWMEKSGKGVLDIASRIGRSKEYVYQRLKYAELIDAGREAFLDGQITDGHAILIARLPAEQQKKALKACDGPTWDPSRRLTVRDLAAFIQRDIHLDLAHAAFDLADETLLPAAGACSSCSKRTVNSPEVFADLQVDAGAKQMPDECTDPGCFNRKLDAHLVRITEAATASGKPLLQVSSAYGRSKKGVLGRDRYDIVEKSAKEAHRALVIDGVDAGRLIFVKVRPEAPAAAAPSKHVPASSSSLPNMTPADIKKAQEKAEEKRKARGKMELEVRVKILEAVHAKAGGLSRADLISVLEFVLGGGFDGGTASLCKMLEVPLPVNAGEYDAEKRLALTLPSLPESSLFKILVSLPVIGELDEWDCERSEACPELLKLAKRFKVDPAKIRKATEEALKTAAGGARREVENPAKAPVAKKAAPQKKTPVKGPAAKKSSKPAGKSSAKSKK